MGRFFLASEGAQFVFSMQELFDIMRLQFSSCLHSNIRDCHLIFDKGGGGGGVGQIPKKISSKLILLEKKSCKTQDIWKQNRAHEVKPQNHFSF